MKKILSLLIVTLMMFSSFSLMGCGKKINDDENTLIIEFAEAGYGTGFILELEKAFENKFPGKDVVINISGDMELVRTQIESGPKYNPTDMYFAGGTFFDLYAIGSKTFSGKTYDCYFADLSDVYSSKPEGENQTISEKIKPEYLKNATFNGKQYSFPWAGGMGGLVYHKDLFTENNWTVPRTTDEFFELSDKILASNKNIYPLIFSLDDHYWDMISETFIAQIAGLEAYNKFFDCYYYDKVREDYIFGADIMALPGRLEMLQVLEKMLSQIKSDAFPKIYSDPNSLAYNFTESQLNFLYGKAAMMPNGDWIELEMQSKDEKYNIEFMRLPIMSDLGKKLGITDAKLREVIDYVDKVTTVKPDVSDEIIARVGEARGIVRTIGTNHNVLVPAYSNAVPLAKDFLKFMASDEGLAIYSKATFGATLPFDYDITKNEEVYKNMSSFQKKSYEILNSTTVKTNIIYPNSSNPMFYKGGLTSLTNGKVKDFVFAFCAENSRARLSAQAVYESNLKYVRENWNKICSQAGIKI